MYLFLAVLGLRYCMGFSVFAVSRGYSLVVVLGFSCYRAQTLGGVGFSGFGSQALELRLNSCDERAQLLRGMWDPPGPGIKLVSPTLVGGFFTTEPPGKPSKDAFQYL